MPDQFEIFFAGTSARHKMPMQASRISAGFPSPAEDYIEKRLDLNEYLVRNPSASFFVKVRGDSMIDAGIHDGDVLIVDRSLEPSNGRIIIGVLHGEFTVKRIIQKGKRFFLQPENENFSPVEITGNSDFSVWGVVVYAIHKL